MRAMLLVPAVLLGTLPIGAATLIHDYQFQNTLADSLGGPSLTSLGGTLNATDYTFGANQGLSLASALTPSQAATYSIYLDFAFTDLNGFRKILDFKNLASDNGVYNLSTDLNFFNFVFGPNGAFSAGTFAQVALTRDDTTGSFTGYVNGVQQMQFNDSTSQAVFNATNNILNFFQDDNVTGGRESSGGTVREIRIYDGALTSIEVAALSTTATPEPASLLLTGAGSLVVLLRRRKRRQ